MSGVEWEVKSGWYLRAFVGLELRLERSTSRYITWLGDRWEDMDGKVLLCSVELHQGCSHPSLR